MKYTCLNCGSSSHKPHELCNPSSDAFEKPFCATVTDPVCEEQKPAMRFKCDSCGGLSPDAEHLCNPNAL